MAEEALKKRTHKEWRKEVKKLRRKRIRQKLASERNKNAAKEEAALLNDPAYQLWLKDQKELEAAQAEQEELHRQEQEELWMRRELLAKKQFREQQKKHQATVAAKEAERLRIQTEFEELQQKAQKRRDERKLLDEQAKKDHEQMLERIAEYIKFGGTIPKELMFSVQSNPNKPLCPFFSKTNACRFGMQCCRNHIRPKLSKILFFPNFFSHIRLEQSKDTEYGCDINLECTENELNNDYMEFFNDVIEELKKFGEIENFRTCMNSQAHLRGNVLVEFTKARDALKAYMQLQGRYYASRRINVEFSPIASWKNAVCGLSFTNKCPKGKNCNFLHVFRNPGNMYNISVFKQEESTRKTSQRGSRDSSVISWNDDADRSSKRNWRWSESPEASHKKVANIENRPTIRSPVRKSDSSLSRSERNHRSKGHSRHDKKHKRSKSQERDSNFSSRSSRSEKSRSDRKELKPSNSRERYSSYSSRKERKLKKSKSSSSSRRANKDDSPKRLHRDKTHKH